MKQREIKFQAVVFGSFDFPANPATTVKLVNLFAPWGFMPQVVSSQDPTNGLASQRIALSKGDEMQIVFGPDRIDFTAMMPELTKLDFIKNVVMHATCLENGSLKFNRIAMVVDTILDDFSEEDSAVLLNKLLPAGGRDATEWVARWVNKVHKGSEQYNVCFEALQAHSMMMVVNGRVNPLSGVKVMRDVSTSNNNKNDRFEVHNLLNDFMVINSLIEEQSHLFTN